MERTQWLERITDGCCVGLIAGAAYLQLFAGGMYYRLAERNRIRLVPVEAPRGRVFDRRGELLIGNRLAFDVAIIPQEAANLNETLRQLSAVLNVPASELRRAYEHHRLYPFVPAVVAGDVPQATALLVEEQRFQWLGVVVQPRIVRTYPQGTLAGPLLGYVGAMDAETLEGLRPYGYRQQEWIGRAGVERTFNSYLRGRSGGTSVEVNNMGHQEQLLGMRGPVAGQDLTLTIDARLQRAIEAGFGTQRGAAVVLDVATGDVLAMASTPSFSPEVMVSGAPEARQVLLQDDKAKPLLNRAISGMYPPGSSFKPITALAALGSGRWHADDVVSCPGSIQVGRRAFHCWNLDGHGPQRLRDALANSCNVYFIHVGIGATIDRIHDMALAAGLGKPTGVGLIGEVAGVVPGRLSRRQQGAPWYDGDTANVSIGQGGLLVTPIQMAHLAAAIASRGWLVTPCVVSRIGAVPVASAKRRHWPVDPAHFQSVIDGMVAVVESEDGTGHRAMTRAGLLAAKTGTAQTPTTPHGWFIGFAPVKQPQIAFAVVAEHGGSGGDLPADIARIILAQMFPEPTAHAAP